MNGWKEKRENNLKRTKGGTEKEETRLKRKRRK